MASFLQSVEASPTILIATVLGLVALSTIFLFLSEIQRILLLKISLASQADDEATAHGIRHLKEVLDRIDAQFGPPSSTIE